MLDCWSFYDHTCSVWSPEIFNNRNTSFNGVEREKRQTAHSWHLRQYQCPRSSRSCNIYFYGFCVGYRNQSDWTFLGIFRIEMVFHRCASVCAPLNGVYAWMPCRKRRRGMVVHLKLQKTNYYWMLFVNNVVDFEVGIIA